MGSSLYPSIAVIMSTYNGQKYLKQQIDSILAQSYPNVDIVVRDDGSTDATNDILFEYADKENVNVIQGDNEGFCKSFCDALQSADRSEYYAFCDQDDIWYPEKLMTAYNWISKQCKDIPLLYYCHVREIDENGDTIGVKQLATGSVSLPRTMTGCFGEGMAMVINRKCRDMMLEMNPENMDAHDWAASAIVLGMGKVYIDEDVYADHRRLPQSVSIGSFKKKIVWFRSELFGKNNIRMRNMEFYRCFSNRLPSDNYAIAKAFGSEKMSAVTQLKKVFYPRRWRPDILGEIAMRILMLCGKV